MEKKILKQIKSDIDNIKRIFDSNFAEMDELEKDSMYKDISV